MELQLKGKTALITGGSEGIGKGIAMGLAKEGVDVAICARRPEPLEATAQEIRDATGVKVVAIHLQEAKDRLVPLPVLARGSLAADGLRLCHLLLAEVLDLVLVNIQILASLVEVMLQVVQGLQDVVDFILFVDDPLS